MTIHDSVMIMHSSTDALPYLPAGYQQRWQCSEYVDMNMRRKHAHAFVDGGMWFNQTDKSLYVPSCGYYYVYSQITFKCSSPLTASKSVFHNLKFERNCRDWVDAIPPVVQGTSTIGPFTDSTQAGRTTTHTGDIVKLCQGGRMWVEIPDGENGVPCPPWGDDESTFIGAVLIANTTCHWPPQMTLSNMRHAWTAPQNIHKSNCQFFVVLVILIILLPVAPWYTYNLVQANTLFSYAVMYTCIPTFQRSIQYQSFVKTCTIASYLFS